jgi:hypothetical protein
MDPELPYLFRIYRVLDPFRLLRPEVVPLIRQATKVAKKPIFFRPAQGPGTGPGSGGGSIRSFRRPILGPVPGPNEIFPIPIPPRPI